ncbi:hypothetical protein Agabi119p4_6166 [Agaricus bisporus var. burnettii]|uniref:Uncharacterized protein n=1 Tax=Agaricus bisporus var. burnettii TaxID=192524 RepID=A0A8H7KG80_AGABI|nr:hypothetical protein Agabi119p4_6166 [Agaricus bisporus var. burnettii]
MHQAQGGSGGGPFGNPLAPPSGFPTQVKTLLRPRQWHHRQIIRHVDNTGSAFWNNKSRPGAGGVTPNPFNPFGIRSYAFSAVVQAWRSRWFLVHRRHLQVHGRLKNDFKFNTSNCKIWVS